MHAKCHITGRLKPATPERGISLVESLMVLGVATAFIAGGLGLYALVNQRMEEEQIVESINVLRTKANSYCWAKETCDGVTDALQSQADDEAARVLQIFDDAATAAVPKFYVFSVQTEGGSNSPTSYSIIIRNVAKSACERLGRLLKNAGIFHLHGRNKGGVELVAEGKGNTQNAVRNFYAGGTPASGIDRSGSSVGRVALCNGNNSTGARGVVAFFDDATFSPAP